MAGIVDALLGGALGFSSGLVQNAKQQQQTEAEEAKETRRLGREAFLMELRSKYNKDEAAYGDQLARGRAEHQQQLQLDGLNAPQAIEAEQRKRQGEIDDYDVKKKIDNDYASQKEARDNAEWGRRNSTEFGQKRALLDRNNAHETGLANMKLKAAKGAGEIGDPDFVDARDSLTGYLGIENKDLSNPILLNKKLGLPPDNKHGGEVLKAATLILGANPHLDPNEAVKYGNDILSGKIKLGTAPIGNGKRLQYFTANGRRFGYGRPD